MVECWCVHVSERGVLLTGSRCTMGGDGEGVSSVKSAVCSIDGWGFMHVGGVVDFQNNCAS